MQLHTALILFTVMCTAVEQPTTGGENLTSAPPPELQKKSRSSRNISTRAFGYMCYVCSPLDKQPCANTVDCDSEDDFFDRCFITNIFGLVTQGCMKSNLCIPPISCCEGHLCNSAPPALAPPTAHLLVLSAAVLALLL